jgi:predicted nucleic acid-binding protein
MAEQVVINTGPLITLSRVEALELVGQLPYHFLCPQEVRAELDAGEAPGHARIDPGWLSVHPAVHPPALALSALDSGEAAVIQLAIDRRIRWVCIDERRGRQAAGAVGLGVVGTLGLLGRAKILGLTPALRPWVERATREGIRYHPDLSDKVLRAAGE